MSTLPELVDEFLEYLIVERQRAVLTIRDYKHYLNRWLYWLASSSPTLTESTNNTFDKLSVGKQRTAVKDENWRDHVDIRPEDITLDLIRNYRLYLSRYVDLNGLSLKHVTQNYHIIALRSFLRYLAKRDIETLSAEKIDLPKAESRMIKFLDSEHVSHFLSQPDISSRQGLRDKALLEVLFSTGLRVSELVHLNREHINIERREFGVLGKGGRPRVVFLSDEASVWIGRYLEVREDDFKPLFIRYAGKHAEPTKDGEELRLTARSVQRLVEKYARQAKLPIKVTPHGIRHSFATDLLHGGADLRAIQELLGHKNISTTQIYTHVTNPQLKEIHRKFHRQESGG